MTSCTSLPKIQYGSNCAIVVLSKLVHHKTQLNDVRNEKVTKSEASTLGSNHSFAVFVFVFFDGIY